MELKCWEPKLTGVLGISSGGDDQKIFWVGKFEALHYIWKFGMGVFGA